MSPIVRLLPGNNIRPESKKNNNNNNNHNIRKKDAESKDISKTIDWVQQFDWK